MTVLDRADLDFLLFDWLQAADLAGQPRFAGQGPDDWRAFLDLGERLAQQVFLPANRPADRDEPRLEAGRVIVQPDLARAVRAYLDAGLHLATVDVDHGGMGFPMAVSTAMMAMIMAANVSASGFLMLSRCGSRGASRTSRPENIVHLVLAKIPAADGSLPPGSKGISLFLVPKVLLTPTAALGRTQRRGAGGLNHKMGYRGTTNTLLNFGEGRWPGGRRRGRPPGRRAATRASRACST
jgi:alkylation response protein AidB-like acyl-CoA dehydrogenase